MHRVRIAALALWATSFAAAAQADPRSLDSRTYLVPAAPIERGYRQEPHRPPAGHASARPQREERAPRRLAPAPDLGGGFIEFLFTGGRGQARHEAVEAPELGPPPVRHEAPLREAFIPGRAIAPSGPPPLDPKFLPQIVPYDGPEKPGTIIIDTPERFLYLVEEGGIARRYGIGVGRPGFTWAGVHRVTAKREWPDWRPPPEMLKRQPYLPTFMAGGPDNPLGARALYLGSTLYRIHGSNEPWTIGQAVSSGCIRMRNEDVIDLYDRVPIGAKVVVI
jgi:lipoprotein-anchoring transpeptidase ErfK/SrfK